MPAEHTSAGKGIEEFSRLSDQTTQIGLALNDATRRLEQSDQMLERQIEALMTQWERKRPEGGLAKEYVTLGHGSGRIVVCTNPIITRGDIITKVSYLMLARRSFYEMRSVYQTINIQVSPLANKALDYVSSPFKGQTSPSPSSDDQMKELLFFHTHLRGQQPGSQMKLATRYEDDILYIRNLESKIGPTTYGERAAFSMDVRPIGFESAILLYQEIQDRVGDLCGEKLEDMESAIDKTERGMNVVGTMQKHYTFEEKPKRGFFK